MSATLSRRTAAGFTLIELMIAVVIVSILATIAIPSYRSYVLRNNRAVAKRVLTELSAKQEGFYLRQRAYATTFTAMVGIASTDPAIVFVDRAGQYKVNATDAGVIYRIDFPVAPTMAAFTLRATALNNQAADTDCATLSLSSAGQKSASSVDCWER